MLNNQKTKDSYGYDPSTLSFGSEKPVIVSCDYCQNEFTRSYGKILKSRKNNDKDCCSSRSCINQKTKESWDTKYPEGHPLKNKQIKEKIKQTNIDKYGVDNPAKLDLFKEKAKQTNIDKYGVEHHLQTQEGLNKQKKTNLEKYGVEYAIQNKFIKEQAEKTNLIRYGTKYPSQNEQIKEKIRKKKTRIGLGTPSKNNLKS